MAVVSGAVIYGVLKWLDHYTLHNKAVIVPDIKGLSIDEAAIFIQNNGLRYNVIDSVFSKNVAPGAIVEIIPGVGAKVKEGRILFLTINATTSQMADIPEVADLSFRQAYALLKSRGFVNIETEYVPGDYKDLAIEVEANGRVLLPGEKTLLTAPLILKVSSGEAEMPNDSLSVDIEPITPLDSDVETWF
ncbi:PASTA domain-containing protein [Parabacteroides sp. PF5-6]|uniref:PASTA domain-containing protein n=1 Tax=Parabacteroides sp. PF5-6 TaxID=1742403 RepID=UPI002404EF45|nr:PASTA domain-containing protein [Parabacteroides sp. PF5-6]